MQNFKFECNFDKEIFWTYIKIWCHLKAYYMPFSVLQLVKLYSAWSKSASSICGQRLAFANKGNHQYIHFCWDYNSAVLIM